MELKGFMFMYSYYEALRDLPDEERHKMYDAILDYVFAGKMPDLPPLLKTFFILIKPNLDSSITKATTARTNGKGGGRPKGK